MYMPSAEYEDSFVKIAGLIGGEEVPKGCSWTSKYR